VSVADAVTTGRVLGLDLGDRRIGVAVCDQDRTVATPVGTVDRVGDRTIEHSRIAELCSEHETTQVVVGLPLSMSGEVGPAARKVLKEAKALRKRLGCEVLTHDERLTTVTAQASLHQQGVGTKKGRRVVDQVAASVILQSWMDSSR